MKKRIPSTNSLQKSDKSIPIAVHLDIKKDKIEKHKHHDHCPLPKPHKKQTSKHKHITEQIVSIKQLKTPILNELRHLICNLINSSDRIAQFLKEQQHKCSSQIYFEDRSKLINYLNSLIVRPVQVNPAKTQPPSLKIQDIQGSYYSSLAEHENVNKTVEGFLCNEVKDIKQKINSAIQRKRSKSSFTDLQKYLAKEVTVVKDKIQELEKKNTQTHDQEFSSFIKIYNKLNSITKKQTIPNNPQSSEHLGGETETLRCKIAEQQRKNEQLSLEVTKLKNEVERMKSILVYLQLLLFKCQQILQENHPLGHEQNEHVYIIEKQKVNMVLNTLQSTYDYLHEQSDTSISNVTQKLKQQAQSMIIHLGQLRRKSLVLLQQKEKALQLLRQEKQNYSKQELYCEQLKLKVNRLNSQMSDLVQEIDRKDQLTQYLKIQNNNIKDDLRNMQDFIKQTKQNYNTLAFQFQEATQKIKNLQLFIQSKQDQIHELISEIDTKNKQLILKLEQIQSKEEDIKALKQQHSKDQQSKIKIINILTQQKKLLSFERQKKQNQLRQSEGKYRFLQEESFILQKKIQSVFNAQQQYKYKIENLQQKIQSLQLQNQQLYRDIQKYQTNQQISQEESVHLSQLYKQLQQECSSLKEDLVDNKKKIKFYEQKVVELAELADPAYYQKIIANYQITIAQLTNKLRQYQNPHIIIQENSEEITHSDSPSSRNQAQKSNKHQEKATQPLLQIQIHQPKTKQGASETYVPFLMQDQANEHHHDESNDNLKPIAPNVSRQHSNVSALSHYDIVVINQNLDTIDVHKAVYPKSSKLQKGQVYLQNTLRPLKSIQQKDFSNFADAQSSDDQVYQKNLHDDYMQINTSKKEQDQRSDKLSDISKNVNVDIEPNQKIIDFEQDDFIDHSNIKKQMKIDDLIITQQQKDDKSNQIKNSNLFFKNVNQQQQLQAQLRFSGEKDNVSIFNRNSRNQNEIPNVTNNNNDKKQANNRSNVYIRIRKQSLHLSHLSQKPYRSSSCYNQQV